MKEKIPTNSLKDLAKQVNKLADNINKFYVDEDDCDLRSVCKALIDFFDVSSLEHCLSLISLVENLDNNLAKEITVYAIRKFGLDCTDLVEKYVEHQNSMKVDIEVAGIEPVNIFRIDELDNCYFLNERFKSFLREPSRFIHIDESISKILNDHTNLNPAVYLLLQAIKEQHVKFLNPFNGEIIRSTITDDVNLFRFDIGEVVYVSFNLAPQMHHAISTINVIFPERGSLIHCDYRASTLSYPLDRKRVNKVLMHWYRTAKSLLINNRLTNSNDNGVIVSNKGVGHIGHTLWNDLSVYLGLLNLEEIEYLGAELGFCSNFYIDSAKSLNEYGLDRLRKNFFNSSEELLEYSRANGKLAIFLSNERVYEKTANITSNYLLHNASNKKCDEIARYNDKEIVILSIRTGLRSCLNEVDLYIDLIKSFADVDNILFVIDGINSANSALVERHADMKRVYPTLEAELRVSESIQNECPESMIVNAVGCSLADSILYAKSAKCVVSPWGAGLVKYKWLTNRPVFVYGSDKVLSEQHAHKFLYDTEVFRENALPSVYYSGGSKSTSNERDCSFTINKVEFLQQTRKFILDNIEGK